MKKKTWILVLVLILVVLLAVGVFVGVKTEFFGLLETKDEIKKEDKDKGEEKTPPKENNAYRVDCSSTEDTLDVGMQMNFGAHFRKSDETLIDMDANVVVDFSSMESEMTDDVLKESISSFEKELSEELGLSCKNNVEGTKVTFICKATKEEIISATNGDESVIANMNYKKFKENMEDTDYTCVSKEVFVENIDAK